MVKNGKKKEAAFEAYATKEGVSKGTIKKIYLRK
jgi:hypothetical protein